MSAEHEKACCCPYHPRRETRDYSWLWILLLLLGLVLMAAKLGILDSVGSVIAALLCAVPVGWVLRQLVGEWRLRRMYDRPGRPGVLELDAAPVRLAIEAPRPVVPLFEAESERVDR